MRELNLSVLFHSNRSTFSFLKKGGAQITSLLVHNDRICFGFSNGVCLICTKSLGIIFILRTFGEGAQVVSILAAKSASQLDIYVTLSKDGTFHCWNQLTGACLHQEQIEQDREVSCAVLWDNRFVLVGWRGRMGGSIVDLWDDFSSRECFSEIIHGISHFGTGTQEILILDMASNLYEYVIKDGIPQMFSVSKDISSFKALAFEKEKAEEFLDEIRKSYDENELIQTASFIFLTPGNTLVYVKDREILASPFPRTKSVTLENYENIYLFDSGWDLLDTELMKTKFFENILSASIILAFDSNSFAYSLWEVKIPLSSGPELSKNFSEIKTFDDDSSETNITSMLHQWTPIGVDPLLLSNAQFKVFFCSDIKSRTLMDDVLETRAIFAILVEAQLLVFCLKRTVNGDIRTNRFSKQSISVSFDCVLLQRYHFSRPTLDISACELYWDVVNYVVHVPKIASWCLKTGVTLRNYSPLDEQGIYIRETHKQKSIFIDKRKKFRDFISSRLQSSSSNRPNFPNILNLTQRSKRKGATELPKASTGFKTNSIGDANSLASGGSGSTKPKLALASKFKKQNSLMLQSKRDENMATGYGADSEAQDDSGVSDDEDFAANSVRNKEEFSSADWFAQLLDAHDKSLSLDSKPLPGGEILVNFNISAMLLELEKSSCSTSGRICGGALAMFLAWGENPELDAEVKSNLRISPPALKYSYLVSKIEIPESEADVRKLSATCLKEYDVRQEMMSFISGMRRQKVSTPLRLIVDPAFATKQIIGLIALLTGIKSKLIEGHPGGPVLNNLIKFYALEFPWKKNSIDPALLLASKYALESTSASVQIAAKMMVVLTLKKLSVGKLRDIILRCLTETNSNAGYLTEAATILLATIVVSRSEFCKLGGSDLRRVSVDPQVLEAVSFSLVHHITVETASPSVVSYCSELLTIGYDCFSVPIVKAKLLYTLIFYLFKHVNFENISLKVESTPVELGLEEVNVSQWCWQALVEIGIRTTRQFIEIINNEVNLNVPTPVQALGSKDVGGVISFTASLYSPGLLDPVHCLDVLAVVVCRSPGSVFEFLPTIMELILKTLDPSEPLIKKRCYGSSTRVLQQLVRNFPTCAFHQSTQRFAIGSSNNQILVFALSTAQRFRLLEGHKASITAICFSHSDGDKLASYSSSEQKVKVWTVGVSGFFGAMLGIKGKCLKTFAVNLVAKHTVCQTIARLEWSGKRLNLIHETGEEVCFPV